MRFSFVAQAFAVCLLVVLKMGVTAGAQTIVDAESPLEVDAESAIELSFAGLSSAEKYWVTIVPEGTRDGEFGDWQYLPTGTTADVTYDGKASGRYEVRLHSDSAGYALYSRRLLVVSGGAIEQVKAEIIGSDTPLLLESGSDVTIDITGLDPAEKHWITIVPQGTRIGEYGDWKYLPLAETAQVIYPPRAEGDYEIRLHSDNPGYVLYSTRQLVVTPGPDQEQEQLAEPAPEAGEVVAVSPGDAGPGKEPTPPGTEFADLTGLWSNGGNEFYYFDGSVMVLLTELDHMRGPGTAMLRTLPSSPEPSEVEWFDSRGGWGRVNADLKEETLTLSGGAFRWSLSRVEDLTRDEALDRFPRARSAAEQVLAAAKVARAEAMRAVLPVAVIRLEDMRALHEDVFDALGDVEWEETVSIEALTKGVEYFLYAAHIVSASEYAQSLGWSTDEFIDVINADPARFGTTLGKELGTSLLIGLVADIAAQIATERAFAHKPLSDLPHSWHVPLYAGFEATISEYLALGLGVATADPGTLSLVGPLIKRAYDLYEISVATRRLAKLQTDGIYNVVLGAELLADLTHRYPGESTDRVAELWWQDTETAMPGHVGADDAAAAMAVAREGYTALVAQLQGDDSAARAAVARLEAIPSVADGGGLFALSAEGPIDLLVKIASGGADAPLVLARAFVSATGLSDIVEPATLLRVESATDGAYGGQESSLTLLEQFAALPSRGSNAHCSAIRGPLNEGHISRLLVRRTLTVNDSSNRPWTTVLADRNIQRWDEGDFVYVPGGPTASYLVFLCDGQDTAFLFSQTVDAAQDWSIRVVAIENLPSAPVGTQVVTWSPFEMESALQLAKPEGCQVRVRGLISTYRADWSGECQDGWPVGEGHFDWWSDRFLEWRTPVSDAHWTTTTFGGVFVHYDEAQVQLEQERCVEGEEATVRASFPADFPRDGFLSGGIYLHTRNKADAFSQVHCPGSPFAGVSIWRDGQKEPDIRADETLNNSRYSRQMTSRLADQGRRIQTEEREAERQRQLAELERELNTRVDALTAEAMAFLSTGNGTLETLAMALEVDELATLERLEKGVRLTLEPVDNVSTVDEGSSRRYRTQYKTFSPAWVAQREIQQRAVKVDYKLVMDIASASPPHEVSVACTFRRLSHVPKETTELRAELTDFSIGQRSTRVLLSCK